MSEPSDRSRLVALLLAATLGWAGAHRFYAGKIGTGLLQLCTAGGLGIWWFIDTILVAAGSFRDVENRPILYWQEEFVGRPARGGEGANELWDEIEHLRADVAELSERVDYTERLLTRARTHDPTS